VAQPAGAGALRQDHEAAGGRGVFRAAVGAIASLKSRRWRDGDSPTAKIHSKLNLDRSSIGCEPLAIEKFRQTRFQINRKNFFYRTDERFLIRRFK